MPVEKMHQGSKCGSNEQCVRSACLTQDLGQQHILLGKERQSGRAAGNGRIKRAKPKGKGNLERQITVEGQLQRGKTAATAVMQRTYGGRLNSAMLNLCQ